MSDMRKIFHDAADEVTARTGAMPDAEAATVRAGAARRRRTRAAGVAATAVVAVGLIGGGGALALDHRTAEPLPAATESTTPEPSVSPEPSATPTPTPTPTAEPSPTSPSPTPDPTPSQTAEPGGGDGGVGTYVWPSDPETSATMVIDAEFDYTRPLQFSPDGDYLMVTRGFNGKGGDVVIVDTATGSEAVTSTRSKKWPVASAWLPGSPHRALVAGTSDGVMTVWIVDAATGTQSEVATWSDVLPERIVTGNDVVYLTFRDADPRSEVVAGEYRTVQLDGEGALVGSPQSFLAVQPASDGSGAIAWRTTGEDEVGLVRLDSTDLATANATAVPGMTYPDRTFSGPPAATSSTVDAGLLFDQPQDAFSSAVWYMESPTATPERLANSGLGADHLALSADGTEAIAVLDAQSRPDLMAVNVATGDNVTGDLEADLEENLGLTVAGFTPEAGRYLVQYNEVPQYGYTYVIEPESGAVEYFLVLNDEAAWPEPPVWSADGRYVATIRSHATGGRPEQYVTLYSQ